jgi:hypothetical protein
MSPLSKILNIRQYVDGLAIFLFSVMIFLGQPFLDPNKVLGWCSQICSPQCPVDKQMSVGVGGLQTALILIGFIIRFQPNFNNNIEVYDVKPENLGFHACQLNIKENLTTPSQNFVRV